MEPLKCYHIAEAKALVDLLSEIFEVVRFVDPVKMAVCEFSQDGTTYKLCEYRCSLVWGEPGRCENCISMKAFDRSQCTSKYELNGGSVYSVISRPLEFIDDSSTVFHGVLEIINTVADDLLFAVFGKTPFVEKINQANVALYTDSLTGAFNRRYYDERAFLINRAGGAVNEISFIFCDLWKLKSINDSYGHTVGDRALADAVTSINEAVRSGDSVIRMGGDEFLIILLNCDEKSTYHRIEDFKLSLTSIGYENHPELRVAANFGYAHLKKNTITEEDIAWLFEESDDKMYLDKVRCRQQEEYDRP